jgi:hypothetical protein
MRIAFMVLCWCVLALGFLGGPAKAGNYSGSYVWHNNSCCYQKVVRHQHTVRCVPIGGYHYRGCERPRVYVQRTERYRVVRFSEFDYYSNVGAARCHWQEAPLRDGPGRWVWAVKMVCY